MKAFRGTLIAGLILVALAVAVVLLRPESLQSTDDGPPRIFEFEKHELVRVRVVRADGEELSLAEVDGEWRIEGTEFVAGRSMVNRVKHQLHDLTARATVVEGSEGLELYGLGDNAIVVKLEMRDGRELSFQAGDPNPSSVSYYIRPLPGDVVYTVKKSAVDYYSLTLDEFRERRFASFDSKDVTRITATLDLPDAPETLDIEKVGEREWEMRAPEQMAANDDRVRRLLGRVSALKARDFLELEPGADVAQYGLDTPRADITLRFGSRDPLRVRVGADAPSDNRHESLAYMLIDGHDTLFIARKGLLDEFGQDPAELRNRRVVRMKFEDVVAVDLTLLETEDEDLAGTYGVRFAAEQWVWEDGVPVPGSTPERVARSFAELQADEFIDDTPSDLSLYGLDAPFVRATLSDKDGNERVVAVGGLGEPLVDPEGRDRPRYFVRVEGDPAVYLVEERVVSVARDMIREGNRKAGRDADKAARRERIPTVGDPEEGE